MIRAILNFSIGAAVALALVAATPKDAHAIPACIEQTFDNYLVSGFSCTFGFGAWLVKDISLNIRSSPVPQVPEHILVKPFGGTQRAGLQFDLLEPLNAVASNERLFLQLGMAIQLLSGDGIQSANLLTDNLIAALPLGRARVIADGCLGTFFINGSCASSSYNHGFDNNSFVKEPPTIFEPVFLIDTLTGIDLRGGSELPGGARLDSFSAAYNTNVIPEPTTLSVFGLGLIGLGLAARRRKTV